MTSAKHIQTKERDSLREKSFKDSYGFNVHIRATTFNDENWDWVMCTLNFRDPLGKNYGLVEYFMPGSDNGTDYVEFEYETKDGKFVKRKFEKFLDAEVAMVELMRRRANGLDDQKESGNETE